MVLRATAKLLIAVLAAALLVAGFLCHRGSSRGGFAVSSPREAAAAPPIAAGQAPPRSMVAAGRAALPTALASALTREEKARLAVEGEAARIARREARLDQLPWGASRPPPAVDGDHAVSKSEARLPAAEKVRQTESMIERLRERIARAEQPPFQRTALVFDGSSRAGERLLARMRRRVAELEQTLAREGAGGTSESQ